MAASATCSRQGRHVRSARNRAAIQAQGIESKTTSADVFAAQAAINSIAATDQLFFKLQLNRGSSSANDDLVLVVGNVRGMGQREVTFGERAVGKVRVERPAAGVEAGNCRRYRAVYRARAVASAQKPTRDGSSRRPRLLRREENVVGRVAFLGALASVRLCLAACRGGVAAFSVEALHAGDAGHLAGCAA